MATTPPVRAFSYIRFSSRRQLDGDSLRRQTQKAQDYCAKRGWTLDASTYRDLGLSAFRGANALVGHLGQFLEAVKKGTVPPGSVLIVESFDRISRQGIDDGYDVVKRLLKAGIVLVTLSPEREFDVSATKSLSKGALEIQLILERAAEESEIKSKRQAALQAHKRQQARDKKEVLTRRLPAWVQERDGKLWLIPERAAVVRSIFAWAIAGYGMTAIVQRLRRDGVPPFGRSKKWVRCYVFNILRDRRAIGEFQPRYWDGKPAGEVIRGYYPAVVSENEWLAARAAMSSRRRKWGRTGTLVNVFAGLLTHARDGEAYFLHCRKAKKTPPLLVNRTAAEGRSKQYGFPLRVFERLVLGCLREIDPREVLSQDAGPDEVQILDGQIERVEDAIRAIETELDEHGESPILYRRLRAKEDEKRELVTRRQEARQRAASPASAALAEAKTLIDLIDEAPAPEDVRLRLRAALRRVIAEIRVLVVPIKQTRLCALQIRFKDGDRQRSYLLMHQPPKGNGTGHLHDGKSWARSFADAGLKGGLDLRDKEHVAMCETVLSSFELR